MIGEQADRSKGENHGKKTSFKRSELQFTNSKICCNGMHQALQTLTGLFFYPAAVHSMYCPPPPSRSFLQSAFWPATASTLTLQCVLLACLCTLRDGIIEASQYRRARASDGHQSQITRRPDGVSPTTLALCRIQSIFGFIEAHGKRWNNSGSCLTVKQRCAWVNSHVQLLD